MTTGQRTTLDSLPLKEGGVPDADDNIWLGPDRVKVSGLAAAIKAIIGYTTDYGTLPAGLEVQLRRGNTAQNNAFTGDVGEVTVDTQAKRLRLHDGATAGGKEVAMMADLAAVGSREIYPQDFGAAANGTTDDSAAFTAAAAASSTVWINGNYKATGVFGTLASNWVIVPGSVLSDDCILRGRVSNLSGATRNEFMNGAMMINQRGGEIGEFGRYQIANRPYRFDSATRLILRPDGSWEDLAFNRGITLDRWLVYINGLNQSGGAGYVEQVRCIDAPAWAGTTAYVEGDLRRAPAGQYGEGYVFRCLQAHTSSGSWNTDVKTATTPGNWQQLPRYWGLYGIYETDPLLQNKFALHWVQSAPSSSNVWLEQRIDGVNWIKAGRYSLSFLAKERNGSTIPVRGSIVQEMGVGQTDYTSSSANQNITGAAAVQKHSLVLTDPTSSKASGFNGNNRQECVQARVFFPTVGQTFDLLITDIQFEEGERTSFRGGSYAEELKHCQEFFRKTNPAAFPARCASYVADAVAGTPQYNVLDVDFLWDRYGQITNVNSGESINWGSTNRAFPNNEREIPGQGKQRVNVERQDKAYPPFGIIDYPAMRRAPTVRIYDLMGGMEGYATCNNRFKAALKFDYTGAGATARPFSQRALAKVATFYATQNRTDLQMQNFDPATAWEDFSAQMVVPGGQDAIGSAFLTLFGGYQYDWDWTVSSVGTNVYYLHLANTQYFKNGAGSLQAINAWAAGPYTVGDVVQISGTKRYYECVVAHTSSVAPTDTDVNWRPYGRLTFPFKLQMDGGADILRSQIDNPATMAAGRWYFGDVDSLGFKTIYVRMAAGAADPGSAAGRLKAQSYDQILDLYENLLAQVTFDAEILSVS